MPDEIASHETTIDEIVLCAAKIIELLTGDTGLVKMAEKLPDVNF